MAMEMHVFSDRQLNSIAEWQRAVDQEGYALQISADVRLETVNGLVPATLRGQRTGFECYRDDAREMMKHYGASHFSHRWKYGLGFRWRGDLAELQAAWMAATAYARATSGIVFDPQELRTYSVSEAANLVKEIERSIPAVEEAIRKTVEETTNKRMN